MNLLSSRHIVVGTLTLRDSLIAFDTGIVRLDALIGLRFDRAAMRVQVLIPLIGLMISIVLAGATFVPTLQFFEPDYTAFALSLLPVLGFLIWLVVERPRRQLTLLLADGAALGLRSGDATFLGEVQSAFEQLLLLGDHAFDEFSVDARRRTLSIRRAVPTADSIPGLPDMSIRVEPAAPEQELEIDPGLSLSETPQDRVDPFLEPPLPFTTSEPPAAIPEVPVSDPPAPIAGAEAFDDVRQRVVTLRGLLAKRAYSEALDAELEKIELAVTEGVADEAHQIELAVALERVADRLSSYPAALSVLGAVDKGAGTGVFD